MQKLLGSSYTFQAYGRVEWKRDWQVLFHFCFFLIIWPAGSHYTSSSFYWMFFLFSCHAWRVFLRCHWWAVRMGREDERMFLERHLRQWFWHFSSRPAASYSAFHQLWLAEEPIGFGSVQPVLEIYARRRTGKEVGFKRRLHSTNSSHFRPSISLAATMGAVRIL